MANICCYMMYLKGKQEDRESFIRKLYPGTEENSFGRIFSCYRISDTDTHSTIAGDCAWSIDSCCRGRHSYGIDLLAKNTKDLNLDIEIWAAERDGGYFAEHYIYKHGECETEGYVKLLTVPMYNRHEFIIFNDYLTQHPYFSLHPEVLDKANLKESDFDEDGFYIGPYIDNGFEDWGSIHIL